MEIRGHARQVVLQPLETQAGTSQSFAVAIDGRESIVDAVRVDPETWSLIVDGASREVTVVPGRGAGESIVAMGPSSVTVGLNGRRRWGRKDDGGHTRSGPQRIVAPMPGKIVRVLVTPGQAIRARQAVVVIEAMKMENEVRAACDGAVTEIHAAEGQSVEAGVLLAVITAAAK